MGFFSRSKQSDADRAKAAAKEKEEKTAAPPTPPLASRGAKAAEGETFAPTGAGGRSAYVLASPHVSEKAAFLASKGTYVFNVPVTAGKIEVKKAVEALYKVKVVRVNTVRGIGKTVRRGRMEGRRNNWKKALVTLKAGQKIDLYQGV